MIKTALAAALLLAGSAASAQADPHAFDIETVAKAPATMTNKAEVKSGETLNLVNFSSEPKADCTLPQTSPPARLTKLPEHGAALVQSAPKALAYPAQNPLSACNGKSVTAVYVLYRSNEGYTGPDRIEFVFEQKDTGKLIKLVYDITVK